MKLFWDEILGHERVKEVLARSVANGRTHHALLFAGPKGVGKHALAYALSAVLYCQSRTSDSRVCGVCPSCRKMRQGIHPDIIELVPEGKKLKRIKIDQIRQMQKKTATSPYEAPQHIVIIDEAHAMNEEAANALLKTLEEPSAHLRLILITDNDHLLLDTIISRCQMVRFGALEPNHVTEILERLIQQSEAIDGPVAPELLHIAAGFGEGSPGEAFRVLQSGMLQEREHFLRKILELETNRPLKTLGLAEELSKQNPMLAEHFDILQVFMRDIMLYKIHPDQSGLINRDLIRFIEQLDEVMSLDDTLQVIDLIRQARQRYQRNVNPQLILEDMLEQLSHYTTSSKPKRVMTR